LAHSLIDRGCPFNEILVLEKEKSVGGLCRSKEVDGFPLDIGGDHFLNTKKRCIRFYFPFYAKRRME
jgi:protoporphyrinogen oxidase